MKRHDSKFYYDKLNFNQGYNNGKRDAIGGLVLKINLESGGDYAKGYLAGQEAGQKTASDAVPVREASHV